MVDIFINSLYASLMVFPSVLEFLFSKIIKLLETPIRKISKWSVKNDLRNTRLTKNEYLHFNFKMVKGLEITFRVLSEVFRAIKFFVLISTIPIACFLYVYKILSCHSTELWRWRTIISKFNYQRGRFSSFVA